MRDFNDGIKSIIDKFAYEFYIIRQDFKIICSCVEHSSKQANPACPKCLGTGRKISIKKIEGASEDSKGNFRNMSMNESAFMRSYYVKGQYLIGERNIIVDNNEVFYLHRVEEKKTANREIVYRKGYANRKKANAKEFLDNFNKIVGGGRA